MARAAAWTVAGGALLILALSVAMVAINWQPLLHAGDASAGVLAE